MGQDSAGAGKRWLDFWSLDKESVLYKEKYTFIVCDVPDKEELVCQVLYKNKFLVEISAEKPHQYVIQFYNKRDENYWEFPYDEAMDVLEEAKTRLTKYQRTQEEQAEYDAEQKAQETWKPTPEETAEYERKMDEQRKKYYG